MEPQSELMFMCLQCDFLELLGEDALLGHFNFATTSSII